MSRGSIIATVPSDSLGVESGKLIKKKVPSGNHKVTFETEEFVRATLTDGGPPRASSKESHAPVVVVKKRWAVVLPKATHRLNYQIRLNACNGPNHSIQWKSF